MTKSNWNLIDSGADVTLAPKPTEGDDTMIGRNKNKHDFKGGRPFEKIDPGTLYEALASYISGKSGRSATKGQRVRGSDPLVQMNPEYWVAVGDRSGDEISAVWAERFPGVPRPR